MKASTPIFKILSGAVLLAIVLYFSVQLYRYISDPISTTLVYQARMEDAVTMNGYIVRQEETFSSENTVLSHTLAEGEKVGIGQTIAVAYTDKSALDAVDQLAQLELQAEQLEFAMESYLDTDAALKLDSTIHEDLIALRRDIADGDYSVPESEIADVKAAIMKRDYAFTSAEQVEADLENIQDQMKQLRGELTGAASITAPRTGTYSAVCDGYESTLRPELLDEMTLDDYRAISPEQSNANVGKLIYGDRWYYVTSLSEAEAALLQKHSTVTLRFAKGLNMDVAMTISRVGEAQNGECLVVLYCDRYIAQTTLLRHQSAEAILKEYEGLRVPANALRVSEDGVTGVYCVAGATARFKPVSVVYQGEGFVLVKAADATGGSAVLRVGDEVIITKSELHDGKVIGLSN